MWKELAWRVDLVGIGRGVTVRVYGGKREKEIETDRGKKGVRERHRSACLGRGRGRLGWAEFVS